MSTIDRTTVDRDTFDRRHLGPDEAEVATMLDRLGHADLESLVRAAVPSSILSDSTPELTRIPTEAGALVMQPKLLRGIKARAEEHWRSEVPDGQ